MSQLHKRFTSDQVKELLERYLKKELGIEKGIIQDKETPLSSYNYSFIKDHLRKKYRQKVSLTTVIRRAKKHGFYLKKPKRTPHDREVLTRYAGECITHDSPQ